MKENRVIEIFQIVGVIAIIMMALAINNIILIKIVLIIVAMMILAIAKRERKKVKRKDEEIKLISKRYIMSIEAMYGSIWEWDDRSRTIYISNNMTRTLMLEKNFLTLEEWYGYVFEGDRERIKKNLENICLNRLKIDISLVYRVKDYEGNIIHLLYRGKGNIRENVYYLSGVISDITDKINQERIIRDNLEKYRQVIEGSKDIVFCWKVQKGELVLDSKVKKYIHADEKNCEVIISKDEWENKIHCDDKEIHEEAFKNFLINSSNDFYEVEYRIITKDNKVVWFHSKGKKVKMDEDEIVIYGSLTDITDRKQKELEIYFMSYFDEVTGAPNRRSFTANLELAIQRSKKENSKIAVAFIDLDNFKIINDTYGHYMGDTVLRIISEKINTILGEKHIFARFGGDEFVILIENVNDLSEVKDILDKIINEFKDPLQIEKKDIYSSLSIGVSIFPDDADTINSLLKNADMAMYRAKSNGKNRYEFFNMAILNSVNREFQIEKALRRATEDDEIYLVFQPKISLLTNKIDGFEALVRWNSRELGNVSPGEFIPVAENSGMIIELGRYIIEESFRLCKRLTLFTDNKFHVAINISDVQLRDSTFVDYVREELEKNELSPEYIEFEITEGIIMQSVSKNIETLLRLKEIGITIALDDFGTGYSSLNYLRRLPIDVLKIDKSFIDGICIDKKSEYIAESIIELSHNLDLKVVAEGVETREQLDYLNNINCDIVQGYYFSKPENFKKIKEMILS